MEMKNDTTKIEQLLPQTGKPPKNKSFFKKHRLLIIGIVGTVLFGSALIYFTVLSPLLFSSDQKTITLNAAEAHRQEVNPSCIKKRVVGYYLTPLEVTTGHLQKLTHIIFKFLEPGSMGYLDFKSNIWKTRFLEVKREAREVNKDLKVMLSIGEWDQSEGFSMFLNNEYTRKNLMNSIVYLVREYEPDGVEIFWIPIDPLSKQNYLEFVKELRKKLANLGKEPFPFVSISVSPFEKDLEDRYLWKELIEEVEFINVLTYDYFNSVRGTFIGPTSPIYGGNRENLDSTMKYVSCKTGNSQKLNLVVPFYGWYWTNVSLPFSEDNFGSVTPGPSMKYWNPRVDFWKLENFLKEWPGSEYHFHNESKSSYYWIPDSKTFITIESEQSLREKVKYQNQMNIGGIGIMSILDDDNENTLLNVITADEDRCLTDKDFEVKYDCDKL